MGIVRIGGWFNGCSTNDDCSKCGKSFIETECTSEYEPGKWFTCKDGHKIEGQFDEDKKGCGLPKGSYYKLSYTIVSEEK